MIGCTEEYRKYRRRVGARRGAVTLHAGMHVSMENNLLYKSKLFFDFPSQQQPPVVQCAGRAMVSKKSNCHEFQKSHLEFLCRLAITDW
jgi:hypothetical protein